MGFKLAELFSLSGLEKGRVPEPQADPRDISAFADLQEMVQHSLKAPNLVQTHTAEGNPLKKPVNLSRPFEDEGLLQKLLQHRNQIPKSSRIIRASDT